MSDDDADGTATDGGDGDAAGATDATDAAAVDPETVRHVADLARIDLDDDEVERFTEKFADILEYFETLEEVPEVDEEPDLANVMRPDEVEDSLSQDEALGNAPESEDGFFKGPKVS
jgi:aspartyl-tRNA(Asn)/glutamyl-tRNA(Gln) amidotransferase subunit C